MVNCGRTESSAPTVYFIFLFIKNLLEILCVIRYNVDVRFQTLDIRRFKGLIFNI